MTGQTTSPGQAAPRPVKNGRHEQTDFEVFFSLLFFGKRTILYCLGLTFGAAFLFSLIIPRQYEATAKVLAEPKREDNPYSLEVRGQDERQRFMETQKELVISYSVLRATLARLRGVTEKSVSDRDVREFERTVSIRSRADMGANQFLGSGIGESNTFFMSVRGGTREEAVTATNFLVEEYLKASSRVRVDQARGAVQNLQVAVEETRGKTKEAHEALAKFEEQAGDLLAELTVIDKPTLRAFPELEKIRADYESARAELAREETLVSALDQAMASGAEPPLPPEVLAASPTIAGLKQKILTLRMDLNELKPFFTEDSREYSSRHEQIVLAESSLQKELGQLVAGMRESIRSRREGQAAREKTLKEYEERLAQLSKMNSQYAELRREYLSQSAVMNVQLENLAEARMAALEKGSAAANIAVVDWATPHPSAVYPRFWRNVLLSIPLGLFLGILIVVFLQLAHPVFNHPRQLERLTDIPVVATLNAKNPEVARG